MLEDTTRLRMLYADRDEVCALDRIVEARRDGSAGVRPSTAFFTTHGTRPVSHQFATSYRWWS